MSASPKSTAISFSTPKDVLSFFSSLGLDLEQIEALACSSGWQKRIPRKISAPTLITTLCTNLRGGTPSFNDIAIGVSEATQLQPSRQAVAQRFNAPCLSMIKTILSTAIAKKIADSTPANTPNDSILSRFHRVKVQDSTVVKLPSWLFDSYSGVANGTTQVCNARIQAVYDLKSMTFLDFSIDSYSKNDLAAAPELEILKGELVLRDRGYLTLSEIKRHIDAGAYFIYRHKTGIIYRDIRTDEPIDLPALLKSQQTLDREVALNDAARTRIRLVAFPVSEETANLRRMKAKKEVKGRNPSAAVLELMGWTIFITNIEKEVSFEELLQIYGLRWRIEIIFKAWKSNMDFAVIHRVSKLEFEISITAKLVTITLGIGQLYALCFQRMRETTQRDLSLMKFTRYLSHYPSSVIQISEWLAQGAPATANTCISLRKYCCYDKRKRQNFHQKKDNIA